MVTDRPLRKFLTLLRGRKPFTVSRWGEQEWQALLGEWTAVSVGAQSYHRELCTALGQVLASLPPYRLGLPAQVFETFGDKVYAYIDGCGLGTLDWQRDFLKVAGFEDFTTLVGTVSRLPLVLVGPPPLRHARGILRYRAFVDVPPRHAYLCLGDIVRETLATLEGMPEPTLVSVSAGMTAPLILDKLYHQVGHRHQLVDFGSLWEPLG